MPLFYSRFVFLLWISYNYVSGLSQLPLCQCECCPGDQCQSQLLIFTVDKCNERTCSYENCYKMFPKKCGLIPGITNTSCSNVSETTSSPLDVSITLSVNGTSSNVILPIMIIMNLLVYFILSNII